MTTLKVLFFLILMITFLSISVGALDNLWVKLTGKSVIYDNETEQEWISK